VLSLGRKWLMRRALVGVSSCQGLEASNGRRLQQIQLEGKCAIWQRFSVQNWRPNEPFVGTDVVGEVVSSNGDDSVAVRCPWQSFFIECCPSEPVLRIHSVGPT
jgi:hypothetical protein